MRISVALAPLALAGCAAAPAEPPLAAADYMGADEVETAARLLAIAAYDEGSLRHAQAVRALGRLGVHAAESEAEVLGGWLAALPADDRPPMRGRLLGPAYRSGTLAPGASLSTAQLFEGGKPARVSLSGSPGTPLALKIANGSARPVCETEPGNPRNCRWTPPFSGRYRISVENPARATVRFFLVIG